MAQHTKSPWVNGTGIYAGAIHNETSVICRLDLDKTFEELEANRSLIAAAPDLLKALEELLNMIDDAAQLDHPHNSLDTTKAELAVGKARGYVI